MCFNSFIHQSIHLPSSKPHLYVKYGHVWEILNASLTLKAYFLLMWSSTDSMEMWKLGRRILPKIPSSFSSVDTKREALWTLAYISRLAGNLLNLQPKPWLGVYFGRGSSKQTVGKLQGCVHPSVSMRLWLHSTVKSIVVIADCDQSVKSCLPTESIQSDSCVNRYY